MLKPWSKYMITMKKIGDMMKDEIQEQLESQNIHLKMKIKINELVTLCGGIKFSEEVLISKRCTNLVLEELTMVQNYWLNEEWDY